MAYYLEMNSLALSICLAVVVLSGQAIAEPPAAVTAEALFQSGRDAARRGDPAAACTKFRESYRLDPALGTLLNIAICEEELGLLASAWQHYEEVMQGLPTGDNRFPIARRRAAALRLRVPRLTIRRTHPAPQDVRIFRGTLELTDGSFDVPLPLDPGRHEFVVRAMGYEDRKYTVTLEESQTRELFIEPGTKLPVDEKRPTTAAAARGTTVVGERAARRRRTASASGTSPQRKAGFIIGAGGLTALAVSGITGLMVLQRKSIVQRECEDNLCSDAGLAAGESGNTLSAVSTVAFVTGIVALGASTYLVLTAAPSPSYGKTARRSTGAIVAFGVPF